MFSLNPITFYFSFHDSAAMLFNMKSMDSSIDSGQFTDLNLSDIEEYRVDYESCESEENISDISVSSVRTLDLSDISKKKQNFISMTSHRLINAHWQTNTCK